MQKLSVFALVGFVLLTFSTAASATCPYSFSTFSNGSTADATPVMNNFNYILTCPNFTGNVGIGIANPVSIGAGGTPTVLQIAGSNSGVGGNLILSTSLTATNNFMGEIDFGATGTSGSEKRGAIIGSFLSADASSSISGNLNFYTNNAGSIGERMRISSSGAVGIGASPITGIFLTLGPSANTHGLISISNTSGYYGVIGRATASGAYAGLFDSNGASGSCSFQYGATGWSCSSDARLKTNIVNITGANALAKLSTLNGVTFNWKTSATTNEQMGVIAQEVQKVFPDAVSRDPKGYLAVQYDSLIAPLISAVNALNQRTSYHEVSDARLQKNSAPLVGGLNLISHLQPVQFQWRPVAEREVGKGFDLPTGRQIGFIAQDVSKSLPEAVSTPSGKGAVMSIAESKLIPILVAAIKELKTANDQQGAVLVRQTAEIGRLSYQLAVLERRMVVHTAENTVINHH